MLSGCQMPKSSFASNKIPTKEVSPFKNHRSYASPDSQIPYKVSPALSMMNSTFSQEKSEEYLCPGTPARKATEGK